MKNELSIPKPFAEIAALTGSLLSEAQGLLQRHPARAQSIAEEAITLLHGTVTDTALCETEKRFALAEGYHIRASSHEQQAHYAEAIADADVSVSMIADLFDVQEGSEQNDRWAWHQSCASKAKSNALCHAGRSDEALAVLEAEVPILRFVRDETKRGRMLGATFNGIAGLYGILNEHALSLRYALDALTLHRENDNPRSEGASLVYIGAAQSMLGEKDAALESYAAAMVIFDRLEVPQWQCAVRGSISDIYVERGDYAAAEVLLRENLCATESRGDRHNNITTHAALGRLHRLRGDLPRALRSLRTAERRSRKANLTPPLVAVYGEIAELYQARGRRARAKAGQLAAIALAETLGSRQEVASGYERLSQWCEEAGEYAEALAHHRRFHDLWITIHNEDGDRRLRRMQAEYETKHARHEAELSRQYATEMEHLACTDVLTGLANRRTMEEQITRCFEQSCTYDAPHSVAITDIDHFKAVNDTFGHQVGDAVIRQVARLLAEAVAQHPAALAGRYGGEEFVLLLPGFDSGAVVALCESFRESVAAFDWATVASGLHITVSVGVCGDATTSGTTLIARADEKLYAAKQAGRNRVCA